MGRDLGFALSQLLPRWAVGSSGGWAASTRVAIPVLSLALDWTSACSQGGAQLERLYSLVSLANSVWNLLLTGAWLVPQLLETPARLGGSLRDRFSATDLASLLPV